MEAGYGPSPTPAGASAQPGPGRADAVVLEMLRAQEERLRQEVERQQKAK